MASSDEQIKRLRDLCDQAERLKEAADKLCSDITDQLRVSRERDRSVADDTGPKGRQRSKR